MPRTKKVEETKPVAKKPAAKKTTAKKPAAKKTTTPKPRAKKVEDTQIIKPTDDLSKFPYETFAYRLEHKEEKGKKVCWFSHESHVHKYIERHRLKKSEYVAEYYDSLN